MKSQMFKITLKAAEQNYTKVNDISAEASAYLPGKPTYFLPKLHTG